MTLVNVLIAIDKSVNDVFRDYKNKRKNDLPLPAVDPDMIRASLTANVGFHFDQVCKTKNKNGKTKKIGQKIDWVLESLYITDMDEFVSKLADKSGLADLDVIGAWNLNGSHYGRIWEYDENGIITGSIVDPDFTGTYFPFQQSVFIDEFQPDIFLPDDSLISCRQAITDGLITELTMSQLNLKVGQAWRDFNVYPEAA